MPKFMRSHDDAGETASVLDDGHTVHLVAKAQRSKDGKEKSYDHLLQALVDNTGASHISKACSSSVAVTALCLSSEGKMQI